MARRLVHPSATGGVGGTPGKHRATGSGDRGIDACDYIRREWAGIRGCHTLGQFLTVFHAHYERVYWKAEGIAMRQDRRILAEFGGKSTKPGGARIIQHLRVIRR